MSCCGQKRVEVYGKGVDGVSESAAVQLSYGGVRVIMVRGTATGSLYRFAPGSSLKVHGADAPYMRAIPGLRQDDNS